MLSVSIIPSDEFVRQAKRLLKKHKTLIDDLEELQDKAVAAAVEKMNKQPDQYITDENLDAVVFDDECPYGSLPQDCVA